MTNAFCYSKSAVSRRLQLGGRRYVLLLLIWLFLCGAVDRVGGMSMQRGAHTCLQSPKKIAVIGGGLAGLATVFHLLDKQPEAVHVTVFDKAQVGTGGASSVAGGLLHPLSPRGKLVHWGLEGLEASNNLIRAAMDQDNSVRMRDELYRLATTELNSDQLQATAVKLPEICQWLSKEEVVKNALTVSSSSSSMILGALRLSNGCQVLHVPSYLKALWKACQTRSNNVQWSLVDEHGSSSTVSTWADRLNEFDSVVLSCGRGLFSEFTQSDSLPVQLVRGQSIELELSGKIKPLKHALLNGKYISPLPDESTALVGATHEFKETPMSRTDVIAELQRRTSDMAPELWAHGKVLKTTAGTRVQSERGKHGRRPIVGKFPIESHDNAWIFTGLSSRGLLYHALYGEMLAEAVLADSEDSLLERCPEMLWWRNRTIQT